MSDESERLGLAWTRTELLALIDSASRWVADARVAFEEAPLGPQKALADAVPTLHQIFGVLNLLALDRASALQAEVERLAIALISGRVADTGAGLRVIDEALQALSAWLAPSSEQRTDGSDGLLAHANAARALLGDTALAAEPDIGTDLDRQAGQKGNAWPSGSGSTAAQSFLEQGGIERLRRIRGVYQQALLLALREGAPLEALAALRETGRQVQALCAGGAQARLWEAFCLYLDALSARLAQQTPKAFSRLDPDSIRVLRRMDAELRMLCDAGAAVPDLPPAREHLRELLSATERLGGRVPPPLFSVEERRRVEATSALATREALTAAAAALAQELSAARDLLDRNRDGAAEGGGAVESALSRLRGLASTLSILGLESSRAMVLHQLEVLKQGFLDPRTWATAGDALALIERNLETLARDAVTEAPGPRDMEWTARASALRGRFPAIEQAVVAWVGSGGRSDLLPDIAKSLAELAAGLSELALLEAAEVLSLLSDWVVPRFIEGEVPDFTVLNDFAGAIAGTEYHIEQRAEGNLTLASEALDFACASLARLVPDTLRLTQSAKPVAPAAALQVAPAAALQIAPAAVPRPEPAVDPEVVIAFHEEAEGLLKAMGAAARREDSSAALVDDLRRQLHTLKGGARLAARQDIAVQAHELESWLAVALSEDESGAALVAGLVPRLRVLAGALGLPREVVDPPALTLPGSRAEAEWAPLSKPSAPLPLGAPPMLVRSDLGSADAVAVPERQAEEPAAADDVVRVRRSLLREVEMLAQESGVVQAKITELLRAMEQDAVADPGVSAMVAKRNDIQALTERWERAQGHLQDRLKRASMLPCSRLLSRLRATVLSVANALGKDVEFVCSGSDVLIDGELLYALAAPLEHLLRNAVDHGIETADRRSKLGKPVVGRVSVAFQRLGTEVAIEVTDDGAGLDLTGIQARAETLGLLPETGALDADSLRDLIFKPGFSTSAEISQISGRGVGLDAARYALEQLGGSLSCTSEEGVGSAFRLALPAAAVFDRVLVVRAGEARYAVPIDSIEAVLRVNAHLRIEDRAGALWLEFRGAAYTLRSLADSLEGRPAVPRVEEQSAAVLLVGNGARGVAFAVDAVEVEFLEQGRELLALPVGPMLRGLPWLAGAAVLGQADVMLVLDLPGLVSALPEIDAGAREFVESTST